ncbi:nuclear protein MDM1 isoform X3 [Lissotriton helveticus]
MSTMTITPVKGKSEYERNFKWKTPGLQYGELSPEQKQAWAGLRSDQLGITKEPSFISKKRVPYYNPQISKSLEWNGELDSERNLEAPSDLKVPEHLRSHPAHRKDIHGQENVETPKAPRLPHKKSRSHSADSKMKYAKENKTETVNKSHRTHNRRETNSSADSKLRSAQHVKENNVDANNILQTQVLEKQTKEATPSVAHPETNGFHRALQKKAGMNVLPVNKPNRTSEYHRQFVWKNPMKNSPMLAAEQMIYNKNTSIQPFSSDIIPRETEYNLQFKGSPQPQGPKLRRDWEEKESHLYKPEETSPEKKMIYNKNTSIQPFNSDIIPRETEYHHQFKGSPHPQGPKLRRDWEEKESRLHEPEDISPEKKNKKEELKPEDNSAKENTPTLVQKQANQKKKLKEHYLQLAHRGSRKVKTEYSESFVSPGEYRYRNGSWVRVKQQVPDHGSQNAFGALWYAEMKELRAQAEAHRHRVHGTHFSRDHLNQILSHSNTFWDAASTSSTDDTLSTNIKALDLAGVHRASSKSHRGLKSDVSASAEKRASAEKEQRNKEARELDLADDPAIPVRRKLVWEEDISGEQITPIVEENEEEEDDNEEFTSEPMQILKEGKTDFRTNQRKRREEVLQSDDKEVMSEGSSVSEGENGRLPTPKLKSLGGAQRTHHDLTTPVVGGAVLVSPPKLKSPLPDRRSKTSPERRYSPHKRSSREPSKRKHSKDEDVLMFSPSAAGMRTVDPIPLRVDQWPKLGVCEKISLPVKAHQEHWNTIPLQKSPVVSNSPYRSQSCRIQGTLRDPEFQHNGNYANYNQFKLPLSEITSTDDDDDRMSQISARSAASSSLASQTLERAQKRKEHFWGKR